MSVAARFAGCVQGPQHLKFFVQRSFSTDRSSWPGEAGAVDARTRLLLRNRASLWERRVLGIASPSRDRDEAAARGSEGYRYSREVLVPTTPDTRSR